ncbi:MAG TPA: hypothetical protein VGR28_09120 [Candidatus Thermoplasmatota archaeon]|jgi:hypothetical protein|nr:hypothetical protein [Candidatus Thermoplasmatota archaeon]
MNWTLVLLAATGVIAGPVVASMVAPGAITQLAQDGATLSHRHFVFDKTTTVQAEGEDYVLHIADGDLYELPLTTQLLLRASIAPAPSDEDLHAAFRYALDKYDLPVLGYSVQRDGQDLEVKATLPAGILGRLSPEYQRVLAQYEA